MNRRSFIKALGVLAATPALGKYLNVFKSAPVREGIAQGKSMGMDFFNSVIKKVMDEGTEVGQSDRIATFKHPDRADILVEVDKASGDTTVLFEADSGTKSMMQKVNTMDESTKGKTVSDIFEAEEVYGPMGREEQEGITGGITNLEEFINKKKFAMGGRVELARGGLPRALQAALKAIKSKFGDDAIKTVTEEQPYGLPFANIPTPEKSIIRNKMQNFGKPGKFDEDGNIDYDYYADILNDSENTFVYGDETIEELEFILKEHNSEMEYMYNQFKMGKLDPEAGDKSPARKRFLEKKLEVMEESGDKRLMTRDEIEELSTFDLGTQMDQMKDIDISQGMIDLDEMNFTKNGEAAQIKLKYPGISDDLIKKILIDDNPQRKAEVLATLDEAFKMMNKGKGNDEIIEIFKNTKRTKQADGGIIGLTTKPRPAKSKAGVETLIERR